MRGTAANVALLSFLLLGGCPLGAQTPADIRAVATVQDARLGEISGLVASRKNPGCYYVHNDSGDAARVFLIDRTGATRLVIQLVGATARDYEDIAWAPGATAGTFDVCVADIGDNDAKRDDVTIYRFPEVDAAARPAGATIDVQPTAYRLRYADGPVNAEALIVDPRTGDGFIFTKHLEGRSDVYRLAAPWNAKDVNVLSRVGRLNLPESILTARIVTAADVSPDGRRLAVRCYLNGWEWTAPAGDAAPTVLDLLAHTPQPLILAAETQGEALSYAADGKAILTLSEGEHPTLFELPLSQAPATAPATGPS